MRTITCFGDQAGGTFLIIGSVSQTKIRYGPIAFTECECLQQCYLSSCTFAVAFNFALFLS